MPWARLDDNALTNPKLAALSDAAFRMWTCGLIYAQKNLTDGVVHDAAIRTFGVRTRSLARIAWELCAPQIVGAAPLWARVPGGYQIHDYAQWNDSREEVLQKRRNHRQRTAKWRGDDPEVGSCDASRDASHTPSRDALHVVVDSGKKEKEDRAMHVARFERFWTVYPNREQREPARVLWLDMAPSEAVTLEILAAVEAYRVSPRWAENIATRRLQFIPLAKTFLRDRLWSDPPTVVGRAVVSRCPHAPPCASDVECTQRELRAQLHPELAIGGAALEPAVSQ